MPLAMLFVDALCLADDLAEWLLQIDQSATVALLPWALQRLPWSRRSPNHRKTSRSFHAMQTPLRRRRPQQSGSTSACRFSSLVPPLKIPALGLASGRPED